MAEAAGNRDCLISWGVAAQPLRGQLRCGDLHLVREVPNGILLAAVDGLGHGDEAADAAAAAVGILDSYAGEPVMWLVRRCHEGLIGTRGVVMTLASVDVADGRLSWLGVGNVEGVLVRASPEAKPRREHALLRGGVVGYHLPPLNPTVARIAGGDTLILATDGVSSRFAEELGVDSAPQRVADGIVARHGKGTDDALVLVARYLGPGP